MGRVGHKLTQSICNLSRGSTIDREEAEEEERSRKIRRTEGTEGEVGKAKVTPIALYDGIEMLI